MEAVLKEHHTPGQDEALYPASAVHDIVARNTAELRAALAASRKEAEALRAQAKEAEWRMTSMRDSHREKDARLRALEEAGCELLDIVKGAFAAGVEGRQFTFSATRTWFKRMEETFALSSPAAEAKESHVCDIACPPGCQIQEED